MPTSVPEYWIYRHMDACRVNAFGSSMLFEDVHSAHDPQRRAWLHYAMPCYAMMYACLNNSRACLCVAPLLRGVLCPKW